MMDHPNNRSFQVGRDGDQLHLPIEGVAFQVLEETETSSIFSLRVAAHVIGWDARSLKAEMDRTIAMLRCVRRKPQVFGVELASFPAEMFSKVAEKSIGFFV